MSITRMTVVTSWIAPIGSTATGVTAPVSAPLILRIATLVDGDAAKLV